MYKQQEYLVNTRGAKQGGVEHLSTPPDFEKKIYMGGWLPLN